MTRPRAIEMGWIVLVTVFAANVDRSASAEQQVKGKREQIEVIQRALRLLPEPLQHPVIVIDPQLAVDTEAVRQLDAFVVRERDGGLRPAIYLNGDSQILAEAVKGSALSVAALAAVLVHEQCHLKGGSEDDARRAEATFLRELNLRTEGVFQ